MPVPEIDASRTLFGFLCTGMAPEETRMNRRMGFLKEFALAQKLICRLWGTVAAGLHVNASTVSAHVLKKVLTKGGNVHKLVVMIGASCIASDDLDSGSNSDVLLTL